MQLLNLVFVHTVQSNTILEIGFKTAAAVQVRGHKPPFAGTPFW